MTELTFDMDAFARLLTAAVLGAAVGAEREAGDQPAGLRTHIAVALGASLFGVVSTLGFLEFDRLRSETVIQADVSRVASNVVVGIGFLGAGVIFRRGNSVRNLTTAASLWAVAAIGLACGTGDLVTATLATAILLASLVALRPLRDRIRARFARSSLPVRVRLAADAQPHTVLEMALPRRVDRAGPAPVAGADAPGPPAVELAELTIEKEDGHMVISVVLNGHPDEARAWMSLVSALAEVEGVQQA